MAEKPNKMSLNEGSFLGPPAVPSRSTSHHSIGHPGGDGSNLLRTISFRVHDRSSTLTDGPAEKDSTVLDDMSNLSRSLALSPRGGAQKEVSSKTPNNFSTVKFLCATLIGMDHGGETGQASMTPVAGRMDDKNRMDNVGTVFSRSTILSPARIASSRYCASRNVRVLELPIAKRMSVPFDDMGVVTDGKKSRESDQESGIFIRRANSDVIWGDTVFASTQPRKTLTDDSKKAVGPWSGTSSIHLGLLTRSPIIATMAHSSTGGASESHALSGRSVSSGSQIEIGAFGMNKAHRRRPIVPALDQMALDLRAGWMGEDDVEEELQELNLFNPMANTKLNRSGEQISSFLIGQNIVANEDLDYFCGIVPANTKGIITKVVNWRLYVNWKLRNFEKYPDCEVCGTEVSSDTEGPARRIQRKGTVVRMDFKQPTQVGFDMDVQMIEPDPRVARESRATNQSFLQETSPKKISSKWN